MGSLLTLASILALVAYWWDSARAHEATLIRCRQVCAEMGVQFLDQTVALRRLSMGRNARGAIVLHRWYSFDFSPNGHDRRPGLAHLRGRAVEFVRLEMPDGPVIITTDRLHLVH